MGEGSERGREGENERGRGEGGPGMASVTWLLTTGISSFNSLSAPW